MQEEAPPGGPEVNTGGVGASRKVIVRQDQNITAHQSMLGAGWARRACARWLACARRGQSGYNNMCAVVVASYGWVGHI